MVLPRRVIVNADDFGQSHGINRGITESHERGIVTSASLMIRWPAAEEAAAYARAHPELSVGLHVDLGEWEYRAEGWSPLYEVVHVEDQAAVSAEIDRQLEAFRRLMGHDPTHLDSHQHVHRSEPARSVFMSLANNLRIPLRHCTNQIKYCGDFYGQTGKGEPLHQAIAVESLIAVLRGISSEWTELACHPGFDDTLNSPYRLERAMEVKTLCDPRVRDAVDREGIELCSFCEVGR